MTANYDDNPFYDSGVTPEKSWDCPHCKGKNGHPDYSYDFLHDGNNPDGMPLICWDCMFEWIDLNIG